MKTIKGGKKTTVDNYLFIFCLKTTAEATLCLEPAFSPSPYCRCGASLQTYSRRKPSPGNHSLSPNQEGAFLSIVAAFPSPLGIGLCFGSHPGRGGAPQISEALPNTRGSSLEEEGSSFGREAPRPERALAETETTSCAEVSQVMKSSRLGEEAPTAREARG